MKYLTAARDLSDCLLGIPSAIVLYALDDRVLVPKTRFYVGWGRSLVFLPWAGV